MSYKIEEIARAAHEINRSWCAIIGDPAQPAWEDAPEWQRQSAISGVLFHLANPEAGPADSHDSWLREKARDGWTWGPAKDVDAKRHPCFLPYEQLPATQRAKDAFFCAVVRAMGDTGL